MSKLCATRTIRLMCSAPRISADRTAFSCVLRDRVSDPAHRHVELALQRRPHQLRFWLSTENRTTRHQYRQADVRARLGHRSALARASDARACRRHRTRPHAGGSRHQESRSPARSWARCDVQRRRGVDEGRARDRRPSASTGPAAAGCPSRRRSVRRAATRPIIHRPAAASSNGPVGGRTSALNSAFSQMMSAKSANLQQLSGSSPGEPASAWRGWRR